MTGALGARVRARRDKLGITQNELARLTGVTFQAVSKWERGENAPDISLLPALAGALRVSTDWLLGTELSEFARQCYLFQGLGAQDIRNVLGLFESRYYKAGDTIYDPDEEQAGLYLLEEGRVEIHKGENRLHEVAPGRPFSDYSFFDGGSLTTRAQAAEDCFAHCMPRSVFLRYHAEFPRETATILLNELAKVAAWLRETE